jgi:hypothetical protein
MVAVYSNKLMPKRAASVTMSTKRKEKVTSRTLIPVVDSRAMKILHR